MWSAPDLTSRVLRHERLVIAGSVALLVACSGWYLLAGAEADAGMAMQPSLPGLVFMWWVMMAAMMLPSATPAILLYSRVREARGAHSTVAATWLFLAGYAAMWLLFSIAAAAVQLFATGPSMSLDSRPAKAALLIAAGIYQLSPFKGACLTKCRAPAQFISKHWRPGWSGAVRLGVLHGAYCVGCCWMLMALLFVGGVMNILWIVAVTLLVTIEKLLPHAARVGRASVIVLIVWGGALLFG